MTLQECKRLLKHFNDLADGTIPQPFGHKDWADVVYNAKVRGVEMENKIEFLSKLPKYANLEEPEKVEVKVETKSKGKK